MELVLILGGIVVLYYSGALAPLGIIPGNAPISSTSQGISNVISGEESQAYAKTGNQTGVNVAATMASGFVQAGSAFASGNITGGITDAINAAFSGAKIRAQQASVENQALNYAVQAFDTSLRQINAAYENRSINPQEAIALVNQVYQQFWQVTTTKIQPNRNGCNSGTSCPPFVANDPLMASGVGTAYCSGTIGATCCLGCGRIRQAVQNVLAVLQANGGVSNIPAVIGDKYGLQTRTSYTLTW